MAPSTDSTVVIVTGPPGVGKTTAAATLAERQPRAVHLESDVFFRFIHSGFVEPWRVDSHEQNRVVMRIVSEAAIAYAAAGYFTVVDGIVMPRWFLEPLRQAFHDAGNEVAYAVLRAPFPLCLQRVRDREGVPLADDDTLESLWQSFADLGELEGHALEVGDMSPGEVADSLARRLADGQLVV